MFNTKIDLGEVNGQTTGSVNVKVIMVKDHVSKLEYNFSGMNMVINFSNYNNAGDVVIPSNIKK